MSIAQKIALIFIIIGGLNWGLVGIFDFNLVDFIFQTGSIVSRVIYSFIGICAIFNIILFFLKISNEDNI